MTSHPLDLLPTFLSVLVLLAVAPFCYRWGGHRATARLQPMVHGLMRMAYSDHLTGLPNRRAAVDYLESGEGEAWVAMVDVRWLREVNNSRGHTAGDELLRAVAGALSVAVEPDGQAARFSGDEFVLCVADADDDGQLPERITERIRVELARYGAADPDVPQPQVCIGWASTRQLSRALVLEAVGVAVAQAKAFAPDHGDGATACSVRYQDQPTTAPGPHLPAQRRVVGRSTVGS